MEFKNIDDYQVWNHPGTTGILRSEIIPVEILSDDIIPIISEISFEFKKSNKKSSYEWIHRTINNEMVVDDTHNAILLIIDGVIIGFVLWKIIRDNTVYLQSMHVREGYRYKGYGTILFNTIYESTLMEGVKMVVTSLNKESDKFYDSLPYPYEMINISRKYTRIKDENND